MKLVIQKKAVLLSKPVLKTNSLKYKAGQCEFTRYFAGVRPIQPYGGSHGYHNWSPIQTSTPGPSGTSLITGKTFQGEQLDLIDLRSLPYHHLT